MFDKGNFSVFLFGIHVLPKILYSGNAILETHDYRDLRFLSKFLFSKFFKPFFLKKMNEVIIIEKTFVNVF